MKIVNCKLKIIYTFLFIYLLSCLFTPLAKAEGLSLILSPSLLRVQLNPKSDYKTPITLINQGSDPVNIQIILKPFLPFGEDGQIRYLPAGQIPGNYKKIFTHVRLTDQGITTSHFNLAPEQKKNLELQIDIPVDELVSDYSDYYFSIVFLASPKPSEDAQVAPAGTDDTDHNITTLNAGIAANILLSVLSDKPQTSNPPPQISILEFSAPFFLQSGPVNFSLRVKNSGNSVLSPDGYILIKNMYGQTIGKVEIAPANILGDSTRYLTDTNYASRSALASPNQLQKILWQENFLLGPYTATLSLKLPGQAQPITATIYFLALPVQLIFGIAITLILIIIITIRVRYRLKTDK